jgi:hypothetical protein
MRAQTLTWRHAFMSCTDCLSCWHECADVDDLAAVHVLAMLVGSAAPLLGAC